MHIHAKCKSSIIGILHEGKNNNNATLVMATCLVTFLLLSDESWCIGNEFVLSRVLYMYLKCIAMHIVPHRTALYRPYTIIRTILPLTARQNVRNKFNALSSNACFETELIETHLHPFRFSTSPAKRRHNQCAAANMSDTSRQQEM